ncbi:hypothetical protein OAW23_05810 [Flavobacteriales bacterium]|nr:hypothetical protein [Flavobacteriales bacterium]
MDSILLFNELEYSKRNPSLVKANPTVVDVTAVGINRAVRLS